MKNFDWTSFTKRIAVKSSVSEIYAAWTVAQHLERWFLERVIFKDESGNLIANGNSAETGTAYEWFWFLEATPMHGKILSANGLDFFQFNFDGSSIVDVKLSQLDEYVIIELKHHDIPQDDESRQNVRLGCSNGWAFYLHNLKSVCEGGIDLRNKDPKLGTMINN